MMRDYFRSLKPTAVITVAAVVVMLLAGGVAWSGSSGLATATAHRVAAAAKLPLAFARSAATHASTAAAVYVPGRITQPIDEQQLVTLGRNTLPDGKNANFDRGRVSDGMAFDHMLLLLQRSPEQEKELDALLEQLNDRQSPNFHHWLTSVEFGQRFGVSQEDIDKVTDWLGSHGFTVNRVHESHMLLDISGNAGSIRNAFHTEIHNLDVDGTPHIANTSDPQIPAALAPVVKGFFSLNDYHSHAMYQSARDYTFAGCASSVDSPQSPGTCYPVTAQDNAVIYNLNPLWSAGISGQGQTIALTEDNNVYTTGTAETTDSDLTTYRSTFGLSGYTGFSFSTVHPGGCTDPGTGADDGEAAIDVEMATAVAPNAKIELISCATSGVTEGTVLAEANLLNGSAPYPGVISQSYGICENYTGSAGAAFFNNTFQQAAAQGVSVFVSSGDYLSGGCANLHSSEYNEYGLGITGWGETPYNVSVGGTDFEDTFNSKEANLAEGGSLIPLSTYWSATNSATYESALSYIPEIPWDNSCASPLLSIVATSSPVGYGTSGTCNTSPFNTTASYLEQSAVGGAGGASSCATGYANTTESTNYSSLPGCQGYPKPSFQTGAALTGGQAVYGMNTDGVRDIPDVAMFASNGPWGHFETVCWSDPSQTSGGATSCAGAPSTWAGFGGTSVASPTMAGIQALINQKTGENWGNPLSVYYQIGQNEYGTAGGTFQGSACNSSGSGGPASTCAWNDVTQGDNNEACKDDGTTVKYHCYLPSGTYGAGSTDVISGAAVINGGSGYTSTPTCTVAGPTNSNPEYSPTTGATLWAGGTQATCTAAVSSATTTAKWTVAFEQTAASYYTGYKVTVGGTTYTFVTSLTGAPANSVLTGSSGTIDAKNFEAAINLNSSQCSTAPCYNVTAANASATATEATLTDTLTAITAGYAGNFTVSSVAPAEIESEILIQILQTTAGQGPNYVSGVTISNGGTGYGPEIPITFGGPGSGAVAVANTTIATASSGYEPAYPAASGYDLATGLGSPNANNLVNSCVWTAGGCTPGIYSPANGSTLTSTTVTFTWNPYPGATAYYLDLGSSAGGNQYQDSGSLPASQTSYTANAALPANGSTIYATWYYELNGSWATPDTYTYTAEGVASSGGAVLSTPTPSSTFTGTTVTFGWTEVGNATAYWLDLGSSAGANNYYQSGSLGNTNTVTVSGLPSTGVPVYATLYSLISGSWVANPATYNAYNASGAAATITSPTGPNLPGTTVTFDWSTSASATAYWLDVGSAAGGNQYYQSGSLPTSQTAATVSGLPSDGVSQVYVTLYSYISGAWVSNAYTYTAFNGSSAAATMTNPASNNAVLSGTSITFTWTAGSGTTWWIDVGSTAGGNDIYQSGSITVQSAAVTDLPANGNPIYVTLYTLVNNSWISNSYTYTSGP